MFEAVRSSDGTVISLQSALEPSGCCVLPPQGTRTGQQLQNRKISIRSAYRALPYCRRCNLFCLLMLANADRLAGSGERFLGLLPLKGERDMLTDIRHTPTATEIVRLSTLLEVRLQCDRAVTALLL